MERQLAKKNYLICLAMSFPNFLVQKIFSRKRMCKKRNLWKTLVCCFKLLQSIYPCNLLKVHGWNGSICIYTLKLCCLSKNNSYKKLCLGWWKKLHKLYVIPSLQNAILQLLVLICVCQKVFMAFFHLCGLFFGGWLTTKNIMLGPFKAINIF